jgi:hypothetical protein
MSRVLPGGGARARTGWLLLVVGLASVSCAGPGPSGEASCVPPTLHLEGAQTGGDVASEPPTVVLPDSFVVVGEWFREGCDDTGGRGEEVSSTGVELTLEQNGTIWSLGTADAAGREANYAIAWEVESPPAGLAPMPAVLRAGTAEQEVYFSIP